MRVLIIAISLFLEFKRQSAGFILFLFGEKAGFFLLFQKR